MLRLFISSRWMFRSPRIIIWQENLDMAERDRARLRSEVKDDLKVRKSKTCFGYRAFSVAGPRCWNNIPTSIRSASTLGSFKYRLKSHYFERAYLLHASWSLSRRPRIL